MVFSSTNINNNPENNSLVDAALFQKMQDQFCLANNIYALCMDEFGSPITKGFRTYEENMFIDQRLASFDLSELVTGIKFSSIENVMEIDTGYDDMKMSAISVWSSGKIQMIWIAIAFIQEKVVPDFPHNEILVTSEERFHKSIHFLGFLSKKLLAVKLDEIIAQEAVQDSIRSERDLKVQLERSQTFANVIKQLESEDSFTEIVKAILVEVTKYLKISGGSLLQQRFQEPYVDTISEYVTNEKYAKKDLYQHIAIEDIPFFTGKTYMISYDSMIPPAFTSFFEETGLKAAIFLPIEINSKVQMYLSFYEFEKKRIWEVEDIKFLNDIKRIIQTILQKRIAKNSLASSYASLEAILEHMSCGIYVMDLKTKEMLYSNETFRKLMANTIKNNKLDELIDKIKEYKKEKYYHEVFLEEENRWIDLHLSVIKWVDGREVTLSTIYDVTEKKVYQKKIEKQANNDFLTGLYNRMKCEHDLEKFIEKAEASETEGALLYIDLDDFKHINDGLGHQYGDILLQSISSCLLNISGENSVCYRVGGDEFILIVPNHDLENLENVFTKVHEISAKPWYLKGGDYYCTLSAGVVKFPSDGRTVEDLIKKADIALYDAKRSGKNRVAVYAEQNGMTSFKRLDLEKNMRNATMNACREFEVYYQPIVELKDGEATCCGAEALIRWNSEQMGFVSPADFIPLAEYLGLINPIGEFVLREAARRCRYWNETGHPNYKVNVNLSVIQLLQNDIVDQVAAVLKETRIDPKNLTLEVTESLAINDMDRMKKILGKIKKLGVRVALDDFGTGYSSLNHIREMPIDVIKIDKCFIENIGKDEFSDAFVKMVGELASTIGVSVCVEGVESKEQYEALKNMKVNLIQGYYFGKPMRIDTFEENHT